MASSSDAELVGVDILQYPVESEVSDVTAPSPSAIPLPSCGFPLPSLQDTTEGSSGRDVPGLNVSGPSASGLCESQVFEGLDFFS